MLKTFGTFEFDDQRRSLASAGGPVKLSGQAVDLLCLLLDRPGELITREEIERSLWPDRSVDFQHSLDVVVSRLRSALGDKGTSPRYIETVPRKGYRFVEPVTAAAPSAPTSKQSPHWARRVFPYAAVAMLAAILALVFVHSRYDEFVPSRRSPAPPAASH